MIAVTSLRKICWIIPQFQQQINVETAVGDLTNDISNIQYGFAHESKLF
jgi:hypothetical protein